MAKLEQLFELVKNNASEFRKTKNSFDGKEFWQPIKNTLASLDEHTAGITEWEELPEDIVTTIMSLPEFTKNGYGKEQIIESNHFLIQQVRIPTTEKLNIKKIIQVALNVGQWKGQPNASVMGPEDYDKLGFDKLTKYVNTNTIEALSTHITDDMMSIIEAHIASC